MVLIVNETPKTRVARHFADLLDGTYLAIIGARNHCTLVIKRHNGAVGIDEYGTDIWDAGSYGYLNAELFDVVPVTIDSVTVTPK